MQRSMVLLNQMGDVEISWDSDVDQKMREIIQKKMDEGVTFFEIVVNGNKAKKKALKSIGDLERLRINVGDSDIKNLFTAGVVQLSNRSSGDIHVTKQKRITDAAYAASTNTVGIRQRQGG